MPYRKRERVIREEEREIEIAKFGKIREYSKNKNNKGTYSEMNSQKRESERWT